MTGRTIGAIVILLVILGLVYIWQANRGDEPTEVVLSVTPSTTSARSGETVVYTLNVENKNDEVVSGYIVETNILDLQELATLTEAEGANYNPTTGSLIWTPLDIPENGSIQKKFAVRVKDQIPATSDRVMKVKFGNEATVAVTSAQAVTPTPTPTGNFGSNQGAYNSPKSGPSEILVIMLALIATGSVFYLRTKTT